jgi:hypothetical protein
VRRSLLAAFVVFAIGAVAVSGLAAPETASSPIRGALATPELPRLLGFADEKLVGVDAEALRPVSGRQIPIGSGGCAPRSGGTACWSYAPWTVSPDGSMLVVARNDSSSLLVVDPRRLRGIRRLPVTRSVGALAWLTRGRLLAIEEMAGERQGLVVLDPSSGRTIARRLLGGSIAGVNRTANELVLLLAPARAIGTARLTVADRRGAVRSVRLERILAGSKLLGTGSQHRVDARNPGFAVDPARRRAFVVGTTLVAEIDLRTLEVAYHSLERPRSLLRRLHDWLEPVAAAKQENGYHRTARWLGADLLAVSGADTEQGKVRPAGLLLVDTSDWDSRKIDADTTSFTLAGDLILARGDRTGLIAFELDGSERFGLFRGENAWAGQVYGGRAYVGVAGQDHFQIVDLADGRVVGVRQEPLPSLLQGVGSGWWG